MKKRILCLVLAVVLVGSAIGFFVYDKVGNTFNYAKNPSKYVTISNADVIKTLYTGGKTQPDAVTETDLQAAVAKALASLQKDGTVGIIRLYDTLYYATVEVDGKVKVITKTETLEPTKSTSVQLGADSDLARLFVEFLLGKDGSTTSYRTYTKDEIMKGDKIVFSYTVDGEGGDARENVKRNVIGATFLDDIEADGAAAGLTAKFLEKLANREAKINEAITLELGEGDSKKTYVITVGYALRDKIVGDGVEDGDHLRFVYNEITKDGEEDKEGKDTIHTGVLSENLDKEFGTGFYAKLKTLEIGKKTAEKFSTTITNEDGTTETKEYKVEIQYVEGREDTSSLTDEQIERADEAIAACEDAEKRLGISAPAEFAFEGGETLSGEQTLSGGRYAIRFSADTGRIHALTDLRTGCDLLSERGDTSVFSYRYDRFGADDMTEYLRAYAHRFSDWGLFDNGRMNYPECGHAVRRPEFIRCERSGQTVRFAYRASEGERLGDADAVNVYVTIPETDAPVRVRVELKGKRATAYVESGALCMPLAAEDPKYYINKTGSVLRPETDIARNANHAFYALEHFAAASDNRAMTAIVSHDAPLVSIGENGVHKFRAEYEPHDPEMRFCLFNNMWGTNFPQWIEGDMAFEFDVFAEEPDAVGRAYARACALAENPNGEVPIAIPFALSEGLHLTGVYPEKESVVLHVQNLEATRQSGAITAPGWQFAEEDLLGRRQGGEWENAVETEFAPYDLRIFRAKRK